MQKILVVVDMQNDFIDGSLGSEDALAIVPKVKKKIEEWDGVVLFTRDTHEENYLESREGKNLPIKHCIKGEEGWQIRRELDALRTTEPIDKPTFGSTKLGEILRELNNKDKIESVTLVGLCTDICVISNAMLAKAYLPEALVVVDAACCAGVSKDTHETALKAMASCQIIIENND